MRASLRLLAALLPFVMSCTTSTDDGGGMGGSAGQGPSNGGSAASGAGSGGMPVTAAGSSSGGAGSGGMPVSNGGSSGSATGGGGAANGGAGGSSAGSGGMAGGGGSGGGGGGAASKGCAGVQNAKFCEDWDKLPMGKPSGDYSVSSGVVVDTTKAFSGTQSLHFQKIPKPASGSTPNIRFTKQFPLASNDMHGRVMLYMPQVPQTTSHWNFITSSNSGNTEWSIGGQYGKFELVCDPPDNGLDSKTPFPGGKWACMQWEFKYPGNDNTTFLTKVDGVAVDQGMFTGANSKGEKWVAGVWNNLKIGWEVFGNSDIDVEFWIDDLAFGEQPIPCPTP